LKNWQIEVKPSAEKQYLRLDKRTRQRIKRALIDLQNTDRPLLHSQVRPLSGQLRGDYRLRVGGWRILFTPEKERKLIFVYAIIPRGDAY
jgi:mRNA interferase RelE/StbE